MTLEVTLITVVERRLCAVASQTDKITVSLSLKNEKAAAPNTAGMADIETDRTSEPIVVEDTIDEITATVKED